MYAGRWLARLVASLALFGNCPAWAETPLFDSQDVLDITLPLDFKSLCRPRESEDCDYIATTLEYQVPEDSSEAPTDETVTITPLEEMGSMQSSGALPVEVIVRGGWRALPENCSVPPLFVRFDENSSATTPFEGQTMLPLTTHCGRGMSLDAASRKLSNADWEQYLLREFLAYRLYNTITDLSLRVRLVRIHYPNPDKPRRSIENYAFFTEHFDSLAERSGMTRPGRGAFDPERLDAMASGMLALFQFMIGNTDFSLARERNLILLDQSGRQLPVPYDFDMSGLVNTHYAGPAPGVPIKNVRERYFLGYCQPGTDWETLYDRFQKREQAILKLTRTVPGMHRRSIKSTLRFLEKFFDLLNDPGARQRQISGQCLEWPPGPDDYLKSPA
jgi:hypothetical protein